MTALQLSALRAEAQSLRTCAQNILALLDQVERCAQNNPEKLEFSGNWVKSTADNFNWLVDPEKCDL